MRSIRSALIAAGLALALAGPALAIQPGTTGTEKRFQEQGLRSGVLIQKNNTAEATGAQTATATLNAAGSGVITTASIAIPADSDYSLTLTNTMIEAGDIVFVSVWKGTALAGSMQVSEVAPSAGSVVIKVRNATGGTTTDGTYKIGFWVLKQSANGSD